MGFSIANSTSSGNIGAGSGQIIVQSASAIYLTRFIPATVAPGAITITSADGQYIYPQINVPSQLIGALEIGMAVYTAPGVVPGFIITTNNPSLTGLLVLAVMGTGGVGGGSGSGQLPGVDTRSSSSFVLTDTTALVRGDVNPNGVNGTFAFFRLYDSNGVFLQASPSQPIPTGNTFIAFSANFSGLTASSAYRVDAVGFNPNGEVEDPGTQFNTLAPPPGPPLVQTGAMGSITDTTARVNGSVNANGASDCTGWFELRDPNGVHVATSPAVAIANTGGFVPINWQFVGLSQHTSYHVAVVGDSSGGHGVEDPNFVPFTTQSTPGAPIPHTYAASTFTIAQTDALVKGNCNANNTPSTVGFFRLYDAAGTTLLQTSSPTTPITNDGLAHDFSFDFTGLTAGTTYQVAACGTNANGTVEDSPKVSLTTVASGAGAIVINTDTPSGKAHDRICMRARFLAPHAFKAEFRYRKVGDTSWIAATPAAVYSVKALAPVVTRLHATATGLAVSAACEYQVVATDLVDGSSNTSSVGQLGSTLDSAAHGTGWGTRNVDPSAIIIPCYRDAGDSASGQITDTAFPIFTSNAMRGGGASLYDAKVYGTDNPSAKPVGTVEQFGPAGLINFSNACTFDAGTDAFTFNNHGLLQGTGVQLSGTRPAGTSATTTYWVRDVTTNTFTLSSTFTGLSGAKGTLLNLTSTGSGCVVSTSWVYSNNWNNRATQDLSSIGWILGIEGFMGPRFNFGQAGVPATMDNIYDESTAYVLRMGGTGIGSGPTNRVVWQDGSGNLLPIVGLSFVGVGTTYPDLNSDGVTHKPCNAGEPCMSEPEYDSTPTQGGITNIRYKNLKLFGHTGQIEKLTRWTPGSSGDTPTGSDTAGSGTHRCGLEYFEDCTHRGYRENPTAVGQGSFTNEQGFGTKSRLYDGRMRVIWRMTAAGKGGTSWTHEHFMYLEMPGSAVSRTDVTAFIAPVGAQCSFQGYTPVGSTGFQSHTFQFEERTNALTIGGNGKPSYQEGPQGEGAIVFRGGIWDGRDTTSGAAMVEFNGAHSGTITFDGVVCARGGTLIDMHPDSKGGLMIPDPNGPSISKTVTADSTTDLLTATAHLLVAGNRVTFTTTGALPAPLVADTPYFVIASGLTANAFKVSATPGGTAVDLTTNGSGTNTVLLTYFYQVANLVITGTAGTTQTGVAPATSYTEWANVANCYNTDVTAFDVHVQTDVSAIGICKQQQNGGGVQSKYDGFGTIFQPGLQWAQCGRLKIHPPGIVTGHGGSSLHTYSGWGSKKVIYQKQYNPGDPDVHIQYSDNQVDNIFDGLDRVVGTGWNN